ncbi:MAG: hypothetical protein LH645_05900 [Actinomycetia bacterium]|nr:hypothetical protein [Actinomycetes bacterium]
MNTDQRSIPPDIAAGLRWLVGLSLLSVVFLATPQGDAYRWVDMTWPAFAVIVLAAIGGALASRGNAMVAVGSAALCFGAALVQFISSASGEPGIVGGNASTWTLLAAFGLGYLVLALVDRIPSAPRAK